MQEGRLAGSRWSGHDDEFACFQREVKVDEYAHLLVTPAVRLADAPELQYGCHAIKRELRGPLRMQ